VQRASLRRDIVDIETKFGVFPAKASFLGDKICTLKPEYEECARKARELNLPLKEILEEIARRR
jgi:uncharacterized protein (DUF111 family)